MCRNMIRTLLAPVTRAESMNGRSFRERTSARITRATPGQPTIAITRMMFPTPAPRTAARMITSGRPGITRMTSVNRIRMFSIRPPRYPATSPTITPIAIVKNAEANPTRRATRLPHRSWLKISRPRASVPRMYVEPLGYPVQVPVADAHSYECAHEGGRGALYCPAVLYEYKSPRAVPNQTAGPTFAGSHHATASALLRGASALFHVRFAQLRGSASAHT